ncbi:hypothetical protein MNBD_GAMMA18-1114 [hydrothermal vent metagenome]|uniref:DUF4124 domain-containing protein n=1 Tax=hydrothermal vent metagenome TaxID=652676 RepID=A0A3B1A2T1_9ZZZZ
MKWFCFLLLCLLVLPTQAATYQCTLSSGKVVSSDRPCVEGKVEPPPMADENIYPNNISSRSQAIARADAAKAKREAALSNDKAVDHE